MDQRSAQPGKPLPAQAGPEKPEPRIRQTALALIPALARVALFLSILLLLSSRVEAPAHVVHLPALPLQQRESLRPLLFG